MQRRLPTRGMNADPSPPDTPRSLSLEYRLPLLITALLVASMASVVFYGWAEVRQAALGSARERLLVPAAGRSP